MAGEGTLLRQHLAMLEQSGISPAIIADRGYRSITVCAELRRLGFGSQQQQVPTLLIPVYDVHGELATYQHRPDAPRVGKNGKAIKYETPRGSRMVIDVPRRCREMLGDPAKPLFITEGAKKSDKAATEGLCCIALLGVWNWRGTNESGGRVALPEWESIALKGRQLYIVFDSDVMVKPPVHQALVRLKEFLESRKASVLVIYLPSGDGGQKVGLDDFLAAGRNVDQLLELASPTLKTLPNPPSDIPYEASDSGIFLRHSSGESDVFSRLSNFDARVVADIEEDDGVDCQRVFEIEARIKGRTSRFRIPSARFSAMSWPTEHLGAEAIIYPGQTKKDHARTAIQLLSGDVEAHRVFAHTGWRRIDEEWLYLHAAGAIGNSNLATGIEVRLHGSLRGYELPEPPLNDSLARAVAAALGILEVGPPQVMVPLFASIWRSVLAPADFAVWLAGPTGVGKSELASLAQRFFGPSFDSRHLPGSWSSTGNALEGLAFQAKDALLVVDDFAPAGTQFDVAKLHRDADRLLRAQGNNSGRIRMRADSSIREAKPPRGLILCTGEDVPRGQSLRARLLVLEISPGDVDWTKLTEAQRDASEGLYAQALAAFIAWLAERYETVPERLTAEVSRLRASIVGAHRPRQRLPHI